MNLIRKSLKQLAILLDIGDRYGWQRALAKRLNVSEINLKSWIQREKISKGGFYDIMCALENTNIEKQDWYVGKDSQKKAKELALPPVEADTRKWDINLGPPDGARAMPRILNAIKERGTNREQFCPKYLGKKRQIFDYYIREKLIPYPYLPHIIRGLNIEGKKLGLRPITRNFILYGQDNPPPTEDKWYQSMAKALSGLGEFTKKDRSQSTATIEADFKKGKLTIIPNPRDGPKVKKERKKLKKGAKPLSVTKKSSV